MYIDILQMKTWAQARNDANEREEFKHIFWGFYNASQRFLYHPYLFSHIGKSNKFLSASSASAGHDGKRDKKNAGGGKVFAEWCSKGELRGALLEIFISILVLNEMLLSFNFKVQDSTSRITLGIMSNSCCSSFFFWSRWLIHELFMLFIYEFQQNDVTWNCAGFPGTNFSLIWRMHESSS